MADIKWIKLTTDVFSNRKIKQIRTLPEGDAIVGVWLQILCLAGQINDNGMVYFAKDVPYTEEMLATEFDRPINIIRLALITFTGWGMIEIVDNILLVSNWEKYQSVDALEKIREQSKKRVQKHRENQKLLTNKQVDGCNVTVTLPVTQCNAIEEELELELEKEKDIKSIVADAPQPHSKIKPQKHKRGIYGRVLLTDEEVQRLYTDFGQDKADYFINFLDEYMETNNNKNRWTNHNLVIRKAIREGWGKYGQGQQSAGQNNKPATDWGLSVTRL